MNKKSNLTYWNSFLPVWWKEIKLWFGWTDITKAIMKTGGQIFSILFIFWIGGAIESFVDSVFITVAEWVFGILIIPLVLLITYIRANHNLFEEQRSEQSKLEIIIEEIAREKEKEINDLRSKLDASVPQSRTPRLFIQPQLNDQKNRLDLEVRNKNSQDIMDCKVRLIKIIGLSLNGQATEIFNDEMFKDDPNAFYFSWLEENVWNALGPTTQKTIPSYKSEYITVIRIDKFNEWEAPIFLVEFHSGKGDIKVVKSQEVNKRYSIIEIGISLEIIFDFNDETVSTPYYQKLRFEKKLTAVKGNGQIGYLPPVTSFSHTE